MWCLPDCIMFAALYISFKYMDKQVRVYIPEMYKVMKTMRGCFDIFCTKCGLSTNTTK